MKAAFSALALLALLLAPVFGTGCATAKPNLIVTPARVQSVTALGSYFGAQAAIGKGYGPQLQMALDGLNSLKASGQNNLPAVLKAVTDALGPQASHLVNSDEGFLVLTSATIVFADLWSNSGQVLLDDQYAVAVRDGLIQGLTMALQPGTRAVAEPDPQAARLRAAAQATR